ncbi:MAG TPA: hypothetical protein VND95_04035 [Stellaceae bacterium]|nr:hypothetical protein [Stellaceae bacterium]
MEAFQAASGRRRTAAALPCIFDLWRARRAAPRWIFCAPTRGTWIDRPRYAFPQDVLSALETGEDLMMPSAAELRADVRRLLAAVRSLSDLELKKELATKALELAQLAEIIERNAEDDKDI